MRTTVRIDDDLYRRVKARAAEEGRTVAAVLEDAVRIGMDEQAAEPAQRYRPRPLQLGRLQPGVDLDDKEMIAGLLDEGLPLERLR